MMAIKLKDDDELISVTKSNRLALLISNNGNYLKESLWASVLKNDDWCSLKCLWKGWKKFTFSQKWVMSSQPDL